jgi:hypothetical protein
LRGWTGALRSGQGRSDVSRKNWYLMGVWKWIQFGVPGILISTRPSNDLGVLHWFKKHL